ncbi:MAG: GNAT family N-acetyltransferase [Planctomycetota bacterium]
MTDFVPDAPVHTFVARCRNTLMRPIRIGDAAGLFPQIHGANDVLRWLCWDGPETLDELRGRYATWRYGRDPYAGYMFALASAHDGTVIGEGSLRFDDHPGVGELGYWLGSTHHGHGHGRDAVELLTRVGFEICGAFALTARVKEGNDASIHVLNRTGFVQERAPRIETGCEGGADDGIAWIFSTTRRSDDRRSDRLDVRIDVN